LALPEYDFTPLLAWEGGYIRWPMCCRLLGLDPDKNGLRELLTMRRRLLVSILGREPLPPNGDATVSRLDSCRQSLATPSEETND
jgi:hypothetical protein